MAAVELQSVWRWKERNALDVDRREGKVTPQKWAKGRGEVKRKTSKARDFYRVLRPRMSVAGEEKMVGFWSDRRG